MRELRKPPKRPKELFWARVWLVVGVNVGGHYFYLRRPKAAILWMLGNMVYWLGVSIWFELSFPEATEALFFSLTLTPWLVFIAIVYRLLPEMVKQANKSVFGRGAIYDYRMQGEIGPYGVMRPIVLMVALSYFVILISASLWPQSGFTLLPFALCFAFIIVAIVQYSRVTKRYSERFSND